MKNLLIITQKIDTSDDVLGFFHEWVIEFAKKFEKITVLCLKRGDFNFPPNVKVLSLGKEIGRTKLGYLFYFYKHIWKEHKNYDSVFVHMNPQYVVLGWPIWKIFGKTISLWYAHGHVPMMLKIADKLTDIAFASTREGYRLNSSKLKVVGQGIDVDKFHPIKKSQDDIFKIITVGRISPSKDYETLIKAVSFLNDNQLEIKIVGDIAYKEQDDYLYGLKELVKERGLEGTVKFVGPIANKDIVPLLQKADLFVNMGHTGSLDKAILEAMSCGLTILTCNEAFEKILGKYRTLLMYPKKDFKQLAEKVKLIIYASTDERTQIGKDLREIVVRDHNLEGLINKITKTLNE